MTHPILPLYDPPDPHPCMTHFTPAWPTPPLCDQPHPCMTHPTPVWSTPPLYDPPHPCMIHPTPAWPTPPLCDQPHPCMNHPTPVWSTPSLYDPPHPCMTHPTPAWPTPPLMGPLLVDMHPYGCFILVLSTQLTPFNTIWPNFIIVYPIDSFQDHLTQFYHCVPKWPLSIPNDRIFALCTHLLLAIPFDLILSLGTQLTSFKTIWPDFCIMYTSDSFQDHLT